jgi:hypothetical protein
MATGRVSSTGAQHLCICNYIKEAFSLAPTAGSSSSPTVFGAFPLTPNQR